MNLGILIGNRGRGPAVLEADVKGVTGKRHRVAAGNRLAERSAETVDFGDAELVFCAAAEKGLPGMLPFSFPCAALPSLSCTASS